MNYIDMLSRLGAGSAHPGGFVATLEQLAKFPLPNSGHLLEVGCGTGRTACYLAEQGYQVTAIDIHQQMIEKAKYRAKALGLDIQFMVSDVCDMPFPENTFDAILAESVTIFTEAERSVQEYSRVLKQGGLLYDREMFVTGPVPPQAVEELTSFFGFPQLLNQEEWLALFRRCGFSTVDYVEVKPFDNETLDQQGQLPDPYQFIDDGAIMDGALWQRVVRHAEIIADNTDRKSVV